MIVMMSLEGGILMWMISDFFKVMDASGGVIGMGVFNCILDVWGWWLRGFEGMDDFRWLNGKCWDMVGCWKR